MSVEHAYPSTSGNKKEKRYICDDVQLMALWDVEKNSELGYDPQKMTCGSNKQVWWKCSQGHIFQKLISKMVLDHSCPICSGHRLVAGINDFATCYPEIAAEWHPTKNGDLLPSAVSKKNGGKIWWICQYGHEWQATPKDRATDKTGCPICRGRNNTSFSEQALYYYVKKIYPDAVNRYRDIFDNGMELDVYIPSLRLGIEYDGGAWHDGETAHRRERIKYEICQSNKIKLIRIKERDDDWRDVADVVYHIRSRRDHQQLATVIQVILDSIDPASNMWTRKRPQFHSKTIASLGKDENEIREYLSAIPNSLADLRPDLVEEWHPTKNGNLRPDMFGINSNDHAWWLCKTCGHEWRTSIIHRGGKRSSGCPECSKVKRGRSFTKNKVLERGSLADNDPKLASEWHPHKNGELTPEDITANRFKNVWWLCSKCGYEWEASPNNRRKGVGCPCCSGRVPQKGENDFQTLFPELAQEWDTEKNYPYTPDGFLPKSGKKMWWKCRVCGYGWNTEIRNRSNGHNCPKCSRKNRKRKK